MSERNNADQAPTGLHPAGFDPSRITEVSEAGDGFWRSCSGCHETEDGYDVGYYPFSPVFKSKVGGGCGECGGLGVVWDSTDYEDMARWSVEQDRIEKSRRDELRKLANSICHVISNGLKFKQVGRDPKLNAYHYAEIPEWMLRQWLRRITDLDRSLLTDSPVQPWPAQPRDSDRSGEAVDTTGSTEGESAGLQGIAPTSSALSDTEGR